MDDIGRRFGIGTKGLFFIMRKPNSEYGMYTLLAMKTEDGAYSSLASLLSSVSTAVYFEGQKKKALWGVFWFITFFSLVLSVVLIGLPLIAYLLFFIPYFIGKIRTINKAIEGAQNGFPTEQDVACWIS